MVELGKGQQWLLSVGMILVDGGRYLDSGILDGGAIAMVVHIAGDGAHLQLHSQPRSIAYGKTGLIGLLAAKRVEVET
jgi:hypothetical protein